MPLPCSPTPAGSTCLAMTTRRRGPRADHDEGSRDEVTFEAQSHSFSTGCLRFAGWVTPPTTQDSLPVAGSALPDGLEYPQGSDERFQTHVMFVILLSHAFVAQGQACTLDFSSLCSILDVGGADAGQQRIEVGPDVDLAFSHLSPDVADRRATDATVMEPYRPSVLARQHAG